MTVLSPHESCKIDYVGDQILNYYIDQTNSITHQLVISKNVALLSYHQAEQTDLLEQKVLTGSKVGL